MAWPPQRNPKPRGQISARVYASYKHERSSVNLLFPPLCWDRKIRPNTKRPVALVEGYGYNGISIRATDFDDKTGFSIVNKPHEYSSGIWAWI